MEYKFRLTSTERGDHLNLEGHNLHKNAWLVSPRDLPELDSHIAAGRVERQAGESPPPVPPKPSVKRQPRK